MRFFTVYGDEQPDDDNKGLMISKFYRLAAEGKPLTVHGDGQYKRDYIHVSDVAKACISSVESRVKSEIFNVGTGENISVNEVIDILKEFFPDLKIENEEKPKGYASETLADISKAKKLLGWKPQINIHDGIRGLYNKKHNP